jgi:D-serine deaminase-like pyridoxal phosphate-dependent protein
VSRAGAELERLEGATAELEPPFALVDLDALLANARDLERRAAGKPIRLASKSLRCRELQRRILAREGFRGTLAFTLPEALWLAEHGFDDVIVAYPTADRRALRSLAQRLAREPERRLALMVDGVEQLDLIEGAAADAGSGIAAAGALAGGASAAGPPRRGIEVCIDVDASWWALGGRLRVGVKRSPVHTPEQAATLAREIAARPRLELIGLMAYEAQIAGLGDSPPGARLRAAAIRAMQRLSARELARRREAVVEAVREVCPLAVVNGGGTGSIERTAREPAVTEVTAGSGLYAPTLFDSYRAFRPRPAALFALPVVRRPSPGAVTVLGGGYVASGPAEASRLPRPHLPAGLRLDRFEGAGEVQTPLLGGAADALAVGDRVWMRHAKAGELCERFDALHLLEGDRIVEHVPTYRGEGRCFL